MAWWQLGRNRREPVAEAAPAVPAAPLIIGAAEPVGAWRDLPALQRTLADSLRPVAITNDFRDSLSSYANPSFLAPLAHQVDPEAGGLVDGLVSPGVPHAHPGGPELTVPPRPKSVVPRRAVPSTGAGLTVQRSVITPDPAELATVPLELPEIELSTPESDVAAAPPTFSADHGSRVAAPVTPSREVPVVAQSVQRPADPELPLVRESAAAPRRPGPSPGPTGRELPVVSRSVAPPTKSVPLSGFAEAITRQDVPVEMRAEPADLSAEPMNLSAEPAEMSAEPLDMSAEPISMSAEPVEARDARPSTSSERMKESSGRMKEGSGRMVQRRSELQLPIVRNTPTLGVRPTDTPLALQRTTMTERVSPPVAPPVQPVQFVTPQVTPAQRSGATRHTSPHAGQPLPSTRGPIPATAPTTAPTAQRLPSQDGKRGSNSPSGHSLAVPRRETQTHETVAEAPIQRLEAVEPAPTSAAILPEPVVRSQPARPGSEAVREYAPPKPAVKTTPVGAAGAEVLTQRAVPEAPIGPAVVPEPLTIPTRAAAAESIQSFRHSSLPSVSRLPATASTYPTLRSTASSRTVAVGPAIPQTIAQAVSTGSEPAVAMSFGAMFGAAGDSEAGSPAEDGFTSVQLQPAEGTAPATSDPVVTPATPPASSSTVAPAAAGAKPPDLDELARRLYEPLTARLRAELWLDRERAGVVTDA